MGERLGIRAVEAVPVGGAIDTEGRRVTEARDPYAARRLRGLDLVAAEPEGVDPDAARGIDEAWAVSAGQHRIALGNLREHARARSLEMCREPDRAEACLEDGESHHASGDDQDRRARDIARAHAGANGCDELPTGTVLLP